MEGKKSALATALLESPTPERLSRCLKIWDAQRNVGGPGVRRYRLVDGIQCSFVGKIQPVDYRQRAVERLLLAAGQVCWYPSIAEHLLNSSNPRLHPPVASLIKQHNDRVMMRPVCCGSLDDFVVDAPDRCPKRNVQGRPLDAGKHCARSILLDLAVAAQVVEGYVQPPAGFRLYHGGFASECTTLEDAAFAVGVISCAVEACTRTLAPKQTPTKM